MALSEGSVGLGMGIWGSLSCPDPSAAPQRLPRGGDSVSRALGEGSKPTAEQPKSSRSFWGCFGVRQRLPRAPLMQNAGTEADLTEIWVGSSGEQPEAPGEGNLCAFPAWTRLRGRPAEIWGAKQSPHPTDPPQERPWGRTGVMGKLRHGSGGRTPKSGTRSAKPARGERAGGAGRVKGSIPDLASPKLQPGAGSPPSVPHPLLHPLSIHPSASPSLAPGLGIPAAERNGAAPAALALAVLLPRALPWLLAIPKARDNVERHGWCGRSPSRGAPSPRRSRGIWLRWSARDGGSSRYPGPGSGIGVIPVILGGQGGGDGCGRP